MIPLDVSNIARLNNIFPVPQVTQRPPAWPERPCDGQQDGALLHRFPATETAAAAAAAADPPAGRPRRHPSRDRAVLQRADPMRIFSVAWPIMLADTLPR